MTIAFEGNTCSPVPITTQLGRTANLVIRLDDAPQSNAGEDLELLHDSVWLGRTPRLTFPSSKCDELDQQGLRTTSTRSENEESELREKIVDANRVRRLEEECKLQAAETTRLRGLLAIMREEMELERRQHAKALASAHAELAKLCQSETDFGIVSRSSSASNLGKDHGEDVSEHYDLCDKYFLRWRCACYRQQSLVGISDVSLEAHEAAALTSKLGGPDDSLIPQPGFLPASCACNEEGDEFQVGDAVLARFGAGKTMHGNSFEENWMLGQVVATTCDRRIACTPDTQAGTSAYSIRWEDGSHSNGVQWQHGRWHTSIAGNVIYDIFKQPKGPEPCVVPNCVLGNMQRTARSESTVEHDADTRAFITSLGSSRNAAGNDVLGMLIAGQDDVQDAAAHHITWGRPPVDDDEASQASYGELDSQVEVFSFSATPAAKLEVDDNETWQGSRDVPKSRGGMVYDITCLANKLGAAEESPSTLACDSPVDLERWRQMSTQLVDVENNDQQAQSAEDLHLDKLLEALAAPLDGFGAQPCRSLELRWTEGADEFDRTCRPDTFTTIADLCPNVGEEHEPEHEEEPWGGNLSGEDIDELVEGIQGNKGGFEGRHEHLAESLGKPTKCILGAVARTMAYGCAPVASSTDRASDSPCRGLSNSSSMFDIRDVLPKAESKHSMDVMRQALVEGSRPPCGHLQTDDLIRDRTVDAQPPSATLASGGPPRQTSCCPELLSCQRHSIGHVASGGVDPRMNSCMSFQINAVTSVGVVPTATPTLLAAQSKLYGAAIAPGWCRAVPARH